VTDEEFKLKRHDFHGEWNYIIRSAPGDQKQENE
jgi:hypothetical protein